MIYDFYNTYLLFIIIRRALLIKYSLIKMYINIKCKFDLLLGKVQGHPIFCNFFVGTITIWLRYDPNLQFIQAVASPISNRANQYFSMLKWCHLCCIKIFRTRSLDTMCCLTNATWHLLIIKFLPDGSERGLIIKVFSGVVRALNVPTQILIKYNKRVDDDEM